MSCSHPTRFKVAQLQIRPASYHRRQGSLVLQHICKVCRSLSQQTFRQRQTSTSSKNRSRTT